MSQRKRTAKRKGAQRPRPRWESRDYCLWRAPRPQQPAVRQGTSGLRTPCHMTESFLRRKNSRTSVWGPFTCSIRKIRHGYSSPSTEGAVTAVARAARAAAEAAEDAEAAEAAVGVVGAVDAAAGVFRLEVSASAADFFRHSKAECPSAFCGRNLRAWWTRFQGVYGASAPMLLWIRRAVGPKRHAHIRMKF